MTDAQAFAQLQKVTPSEAVSYLRARGQLAVTYGWQDLWQDEHAQQFTISRLTHADLLQTLRDKITASVEGDLSRRDFMRDARSALEDAGWWGTSEVIEPETGEILKTKFDPSRLKLIYDVNTRQAYGAGQWERLQSTKRTHPYARYITKGDERVREAHRAWHNLTLPVDHPFWQTHWCPNGYRCRCRIVAVTQKEYDAGVTPTGAPMVKEAPEIVLRDWLNRRTGETLQVPVGIDPGFGYNPGQARQRALNQLVQDKLVALDAPLGAALWENVKGGAAAGLANTWRALVNDVARTSRSGGATALVHVVDASTQMALADHGVTLASAAVLMRDSELVHALRDLKSTRSATLTPAIWAELPALLKDATPYLDQQDQALLYVIDLPQRAGKVVVRMNYAEKARFGDQRARVVANFVRTGGVIDAANALEPHLVELKR